MTTASTENETEKSRKMHEEPGGGRDRRRKRQEEDRLMIQCKSQRKDMMIKKSYVKKMLSVLFFLPIFCLYLRSMMFTKKKDSLDPLPLIQFQLNLAVFHKTMRREYKLRLDNFNSLT